MWLKRKTKNMTNSYLTFKLHNEHFAVNVNKVLEVLQEFKIVEVPDAPEYIKGMINFRGNIIPIINFRQKFQFPKNESEQNKVIILEIIIDDNPIKFGAIVDKVNDVFEINEQDIKEKPEFGSKYNPEYMEGMINKDDNYFMLLNIEKVFTDKEIDIINKL